MTELKPCPFCGARGCIIPANNGFYGYCDACNCETEGKPTAFEAIAAWNTRTPPEPATDAELVELAAKAAAMSQSKRMRGNEREWQVYLCEGLRADVRAVIAAITPAIRAQERAKIVAIIQDEQATRERLASEHHDYTARYHNECRAMECANLVTLIEQGTHDNG